MSTERSAPSESGGPRPQALLTSQEQAALLQSLLSHAPLGYGFYDRGYRCVLINETLAAIAGIPVSGHLGKPLCEVLPVNAKIMEPILAKVFETGQPLTNIELCGETTAEAGLQRHWLACFYPISTKEQVLRWVGVVLTEITERRRAEEALRASEQRLRKASESERQRARQLMEADRRKDEFLAVLAHELRNPLAPIQNAMQILRMSCMAQPVAKEPLDIMQRQIRHMVRLVDDLLEVSRITRGKVVLRKERIDLASVMENAIETCRPLIDAAQHTLNVQLPTQPLYLMADATRLSQVFSNLLNNATKYTNPGGKIDVSAEVLQSPSAFNPEVVVRIKDTGIGIPAELLPRVFDMFGQIEQSLDHSRGGLGIGLTLVRRLVQLHGGSVRALSDGSNQGSEFIVSLPLSVHQDAPPPAAIEHASEDLLTPHRILLVDDNEDSATILGKLLELQGHTVEVVFDGPAALEAMPSFKPEIVLLDIGLPGMSGYDVARRIREAPESRDVVLIAQTGWGQKEDRERSREAGFDHHLVKPIDPNTLQKLLASLAHKGKP